MPTIQDAMAALLASLGFVAMAEDVRDETDISRLRRYARVCVNSAPANKKAEMANLFRLNKPPLM